ncbi:dipicolinate synthase subunit B [Dehalobacterium formicoaceticum]|uniref:Dipicolinate synthase subunit B n=1 Tax=Dehalobacterium formicoaceticum TaxID=51515 RepID=A0ABT1Y4W2_9FIRM|nr:dipicolinate synthase subunit B [Dehalobacterium formicoaceticum]MCR6545908.1 dipicolinate synthase subunit B [Dehalobacterium formicoaceticum]
MRLKDKKIGFALTGSHCTIEKVIKEIERLIHEEGAEVYPIISHAVDSMDTRFGTAAHWKEALEKTTQNKVITTIVGAEPIGPKNLLDVLVIAPCTGNTMAKLAHGITDSTVLMAAKATLRNQNPVVVAISTNDGLGFAACNLGILLNSKNIYFVPFGQDNPAGKSNSLVAHMSKIADTVVGSLQGKQIQPVLVQYEEACC